MAETVANIAAVVIIATAFIATATAAIAANKAENSRAMALQPVRKNDRR